MAKFKSFLIQNGTVDEVQFNNGISDEIVDVNLIEKLKKNILVELISDNVKAVQQAEIDIAEFNMPEPVAQTANGVDVIDVENIDVSKIDTMKYAEIRALASKYELDVSGKTEDLRARVKEHLTK